MKKPKGKTLVTMSLLPHAYRHKHIKNTFPELNGPRSKCIADIYKHGLRSLCTICAKDFPFNVVVFEKLGPAALPGCKSVDNTERGDLQTAA
jgi:hypothetical protein